MGTNKLALASLAMDLKRVALGLHRGSSVTATRFIEEARKRKAETDRSALKPYMQSVMSRLDKILKQSGSERKAEDLLMFSQLIQNYVVHYEK